MPKDLGGEIGVSSRPRRTVWLVTRSPWATCVTSPSARVLPSSVRSAQGTRGPRPPCIAPPRPIARVLRKGAVGPRLAGRRAPRIGYVPSSEEARLLHTVPAIAASDHQNSACFLSNGLQQSSFYVYYLARHPAHRFCFFVPMKSYLHVVHFR